MGKFYFYVAFCIVITVISGCASISNKSVSYGVMPKNFKQIEADILEHLKRDLFDFDGMKNFSISATPRKCFWKKDGNNGFAFETIYGWCYTYELNSKNRFGGYTGIQQYLWRVHTEGTIASFMTFGSGFAD